MHEFSEAGVSVCIEAPADPDGMVRRAEFESDAGDAYWAHLWPASKTLASFVARSAIIGPGSRVLEIGCGLGLCGLVAAAKGASVTLTDRVDEALAIVGANAARNGLDVRVRRFDWSDPGSIEPSFDAVLGADVLYAPEAHAPIARLIERLGCLSLICDPNRRSADGFVEALRERGVSVWTAGAPGGRIFMCQREEE